MGLSIKSVDKDSALSRQAINVPLFNTANTQLSAGTFGHIIAPFDCKIEKIWLSNDSDITASNGIVVSVCNATTDVVYMAGTIWSCSMATPLYCASGSLDYTASIFCEIDTTKSINGSSGTIRRGDLLSVRISATKSTARLALSLVLSPNLNVK